MTGVAYYLSVLLALVETALASSGISFAVPEVEVDWTTVTAVSKTTTTLQVL